MPSPLVLVSVNAGPANPTGLNGLDVTPAGTVVVTLQSPAGVTNWYLQVGLVTGGPPVVTAGTGTDETQVSPPVLTGVNGSGLVTGGPTGTATFTFPGVGTALLFSSTVTGGFGTITTTFGLFAPTSAGYRVGAAGMSREGSAAYGWTNIVNPAVRNIGGNVSSVSGTSPIASSGGATPIISFDILNQAQGDIVYFNGTFWVRLPAGTPGETLITGGPSANPSWGTIVSGINQLTGDIVAGPGSGSQDAIVQSIAAINQTTPGLIQSVPVFGAMLNPQDAVTRGVTPPTIGGGPPGGQVGHVVWEATYSSGSATLGYGWLAMSKSGQATVLAPEVYGTHNSQACFRGALTATARLTGPGTSTVFNFNILNGHTSKMCITITARVVTVGTGGIESVGDTYAETTWFTAKSVAGVVSIVTNVTALPYVDADTSMVDVVTSPGTTGTQVQITIGNGSMIGTGAVVDYQIDIDGRIC